MPISADKQIAVNGIIFSLNELRTSSDKYLPMITPMFRASTLQQKDREDFAAYLGRLFYLCYYKKGLAADGSQTRHVVHERINRSTRASNRAAMCQAAAECNNILNALGIDVVKYNPKVSRILFKNTGNEYRVHNDEMSKLIKSIKSKPNLKRNKMDVKIGVELEFIGHRGRIDTFNKMIRNLVGEDRYECVLQYNHNHGDKWILGTDGSLNYSSSAGERGYELTSPILNPDSKSDMHELEKVIELVKETFDANTNNSCGTHVHMSFNTGTENKNQKYELRKFIAESYCNNEDNVFDKVVPLRRRGSRSRWCRRVSVCNMGDRYRKVNFQNDDLNKTDNMHIEFRQLDGTLDFNKIASWIKLQKMFIELTMQNFKNKNDYFMNEIRKFTIEDAITDKVFSISDVESLLKEGKLIA